MKPLQIVIMAAGKGTRMGNPDLPKVLTPLNKKPLLHHLLENLTDLKLKEIVDSIVIIVGHHAEKVKSAVEGDYLFAHQHEQLGSAHAILSAKDQITAPYFVALNGDSPFVTADSILRMFNHHVENNAKVSTFTVTVPNFEKEFKAFASFGKILRDAEGNFTAIREIWDTDDEEKKIMELSSGSFMFDAKWAWENISKIKNENKKNEYYLPDIVRIAREQGVKVYTVPIHPYEVYGINSVEDLLVAEDLILREANEVLPDQV